VKVFNAQESFDDDFTVLLLEFWEQATKVDLDPTDGENVESDGFIEF
jgi:hypothetical protein